MTADAGSGPRVDAVADAKSGSGAGVGFGGSDAARVGTLPLAAARTEAARVAVGECAVGLPSPAPAERLVGVEIEPERDVGGIEIECLQTFGGEVLVLIDLAQRSGRLVEEVTGEPCATSGGESFEVSAQGGVDPAKGLAGVPSRIR